MLNSKLKIVLGVAALAAVIGVSMWMYQVLSESYAPQNALELSPNATASAGDPAGEPEKTKAPDFSVTDAQGNAVKLSDFLGKPVVVNFWASWCPPCKSEMPEFEKVWKELGEDVTFLMVNATDGARETEEKAKDFIAEQGYTFPVYYDIGQEASYTYGISSLPTTLFIDKDGYLVSGARGMIDEDALRSGIALVHTAEEIKID